jgi:proteasome assembly chaperone (PAC2) family protein
MANPALTFFNTPAMTDATMLLALTGWMDGGDVSTGTVKRLMAGREIVPVAEMAPGGFYIDSFPGSMEIAALFRPHVKYKHGLIKEFDMPANQFFADPANNLAFFVGKEPNLNWPAFAECIYDVCDRLRVSRIIFMGSFGGTVPHTREPRLFGSVSDPKLLSVLKEHGIQRSDYEGPASFATYLLHLSPQRGVDMLSIAAEIPGYLQGTNPLSIEAVTRRLVHMINLQTDLSDLRALSTAWELQVTEAIDKDEQLAETVKKLEEQYDNELIAREKE